MRFIIKNVPASIHEELGEKSLPHPNYPTDLHLDATKVSVKELKAILNKLGKNAYIKLSTEKRARAIVIHARQAVAGGIAAATAVAAYFLS